MKQGNKVRITGQSSILTITGETIESNGITYFKVRERSFYIPKSKLELIKL